MTLRVLQEKPQKLQNRGARVLMFSNYDRHADAGPFFEIWGRKNINRQRNIQKATMVLKYLHGLAPNTSYNLRDSESKLNVRLPRAKWRHTVEYNPSLRS